jgi:cytochrome c oxidase assembly protein Cox11
MPEITDAGEKVRLSRRSHNKEKLEYTTVSFPADVMRDIRREAVRTRRSVAIVVGEIVTGHYRRARRRERAAPAVAPGE